ncbi:MAG TPA: two-component regulator propeller domain-containing protein [Hyalangium sp.]|nr:two-component regulator propeller domain-containing protein [Hyalangium sp.]
MVQSRVLAVLVGLITLLGAPGRGWALEPGKALPQFPHSSWGTEDGLPQNSVLALAQTPDGYLWAGTGEGLVRFDGIRFTLFDEATTPELPENLIRCLETGPDGTLWIGTRAGLARMRQGAFHAVVPPEGMILRNPIDLMAARDGSLWISTFRNGVFRYSEGRFRAWTTHEGLAGDSVFALAEDSKGLIWAGSAGGLQRWDGTAWSTPLPFEGKDAVMVRSLTVDREGVLWAGTEHGDVYRLEEGKMRRVAEASLPGAPIPSLRVDGAGSLWVGSQGRGLLRWSHGRASTPDAAQGLGGSAVFALLEDAEGNFWIGTDGGGLHRFKDAPFTPYGPPEGLAHEIVVAIHEARDGSVWLATLGGGVSRWRDGQVSSWTTREGLLQNRITSIAEGQDGSLWFGTWHGVSRWQSGKISSYGEKEGVPKGLVRTLHEDAQGTLWMGSDGGLARWTGERFELFTPEGGLPGQAITLLHGSAAGGVFVGTGSGGLAHLQGGRTTLLAPENGPVSGEILTIHEDRSGELWIGTERGLFRWKGGRFWRFSRAEGLFDNRVFQILPDGHGSLWMSCNKGVFRVSLAELRAVAEGTLAQVKSTVYGTEDGMRSEECNGLGSPAGARTRDGRLWFPTIRGAAVYTPEAEKPPASPPPAIIEDVRVNGLSVPAAAWNNLSVGDAGMEIHYTSTSLRAPQRLRFFYQLKGMDAGWVQAGTRRVAYYTHLPPGHYQFHVRAETPEGGAPSQVAEIQLYLPPRFYQTLLFQVACGLAGALVVAGGVWLRLRQMRRREQELKERVEERTTELATVNVALESRLQELQTTRERLAHAEKMAAVGTLAAGVGHEINNPLAFIISNLHFVSEEVQEVAKRDGNTPFWKEVEDALSEALNGADRVRRIVQDLRAFSRVQPQHPQRVDLHTVLDMSLSIAEAEIRRRARVVKEYGLPPAVMGDETRLSQVFLNLLVNAAQAIPEGNTQKNEIRITTWTDERGEAVVAISDTGKGITPEVLPRIFEPFFTTKPVGVGTGLGLSICHTYVQDMGGDIRVQSVPGRGSTFEVVLPPARQEQPELASKPEVAASASAPAARLMVIDDEPLLTTALSRTLSTEHRVEAFTSARQALERLRAGERYSLILCDLMMPDMTGMELHETLSREAPGVAERMVFLTGGVSSDAARTFLNTTRQPWIEKPFEPDSLRASVRMLLVTRPSA